MNLNKLAVGVLRALLIRSGDGAAGADHRVCRLAEDQTWTTGRDNHRVCRKRFKFEGLQVHRDQSATDLMIVEHEGQHLPMLKFPDLAAGFESPHLFVKRVEQLLSG